MTGERSQGRSLRRREPGKKRNGDYAAEDITPPLHHWVPVNFSLQNGGIVGYCKPVIGA